MKSTLTNITETLETKNVSRLENLIIENKGTETTKKLDDKNAKAAARKEKSENKKAIKAAWLTATRSKNAIKKYISENSELIQPLLDNINTINNTNFDVGVFNGTLEKFALTFEINKIDINGNIIEAKDDIRSIEWYLNLLDRKAKYIDFNDDKFVKYSNDRLQSKLIAKVKNTETKILFQAKAELSQANYNKVVKAWNNKDTSKLNNFEYIQALENVVKELTPTKLLKL